MTNPETASGTSRLYKPPLKILIPVTIALWLAIALFNTGIFVFSFEDEGPLYEFFHGLRWTPIYHSPWLILIPCILYFARKFPLNEKITLKNISIHIALALGITSVASIFHTYFIYIRIEETFLISSVPGNFLFYSVDRLLIYFAILLGYYAIDYYQKQNEESLRELKLQETINRQNLNSFKKDLQPGFLLNTIEDIGQILAVKPELAEKMIADLAQMIRKMLQNSQKNTIYSYDDLLFLKSYLTILEVRLQKNIRVYESIEDKSKNQTIAISLFVIGIVEELINRDRTIFRDFQSLEYQALETKNSFEINVKLKRLLLPRQDFKKWLTNGLQKTLDMNQIGQRPASLKYTENGTLHLSVSSAKSS